MITVPDNEFVLMVFGHHPLSNPTQHRCSYCGKKSKYVCSKCSIGLHIDCFDSYHENVNQ